MKICLLSRTFSLEGGGIGRVGIEIRDKLKERGHYVCTLSTKGTSLYSYFLYTSLGIPIRLPRGMDVYHAITPMESIWIPKEKGVAWILDIIAITHPELYGGRWSGSIATFHDLFPLTHSRLQGAGLTNNAKSLVGTRYFEFACRKALKCKHIVTVSEHVKQEVMRVFNVEEDRIKVIKSGIRDDLEPWEKRNKKFRVGYLGQLDKRKRIDLLIEAFKKSALEELVIGGKGLDENALRLQAGNDPRIKFLGLIPDEKLPAFYNSLDVFVFPTAIEGYGLPPVEAMACKKPVVVLHDAIIPWEVKRRCTIVEELEYVLGNQKYLEELCQSIDIEGNYTWAKAHSWDKCVDEYIKLYEEVLV